jgi:DNA-binding CsgD family transcriptional regulator
MGATPRSGCRSRVAVLVDALVEVGQLDEAAEAIAQSRAGGLAGPERVVQMAAEGMTNREIAQALFVTEKTIEWHLGQAYRKLDVRSRSELGALV